MEQLSREACTRSVRLHSLGYLQFDIFTMPSSSHSSQLYILVEASLAQTWCWFLLMQSSGNTEQPCSQKTLALEATDKRVRIVSPLSDCRETAATWASPNITISSLDISQRLLRKLNCSWQHYPTKQCQPCYYDAPFIFPLGFALFSNQLPQNLCACPCVPQKCACTTTSYP